MDRILKLESAYFANKSIKAEEKRLTVYQPPHWHDFFEIEYIIDGAGEYITNGNSTQIKPGTMFFSTPTDIHEIIFSKETHLINLSFTSHYIDDKLVSSTLFSYKAQAKDDYYEYMLRSILKVIESPVKNSSLYFKSIVTAILIMLLNQGTPLDTTGPTISSHKSLRDIIYYINKHFNEPLDLSTLAAVANLTPKYLSKKFIELSGTSISQYILDVRLNYAKNLIVTTDIPIKQICFNSGFNEISHFSRSFKSRYKLAPSKLRDIATKAKN